MNDQSKQNQKTQPTDIISSINKNKTELKNSEKNKEIDNEWDEYSEEDEAQNVNPTSIKEKENKDKNAAKGLADILGNKKPIAQKKKTYNNDQGERKPKEGGLKKFYNKEYDANNKNFNSNQNPNYQKRENPNYQKRDGDNYQKRDGDTNYQKRDKDVEKIDLEKKLGSITNILKNNEASNQGYKTTKTYETEQNQEKEEKRPEFINANTGEKQKELNTGGDLFLKKLKEKGFDKEPEREEGDQDDADKQKRKPYVNKPKTYNANYTGNTNYTGSTNYSGSNSYTGSKNYQNKKQSYQDSSKRDEKELDEDGFEIVNNHKEPKPRVYEKKYQKSNRNYNDNERLEKVWEETLKVPNQDENENRENNNHESNTVEQTRDEDRPREKKEFKSKTQKKVNANVWENDPVEKKEKEVEVKQPTKVEFTMKASNLKDIFAKKK